MTLGPEREIKGWIKMLSQWPPPDERVKRCNLNLLRAHTAGYVAITDSPGCSLVQELVELYPKAKVICTVRDVSSWEKSMAGVASASTKWFLRLVLLPLPSLRYFVSYIDGLRDMWLHLYGETEPPTRQSWERHMEMLMKTVPASRLVFFDVKDGWAPLCEALNMPIPRDVPFPCINDGKAIEEFSKDQITRGLMRWAVIFAATGVLAALVLQLVC